MKQFDAEEPQLAYCAISHVWADRLANGKHNNLPSCQFERISKIVPEKLTYRYGENRNKVTPEGRAENYIWMDSFCIPSDPRYQALRDLSIMRMSEIYEEAAGVLVLDADLMAAPVISQNTELIAYVLFSGWMQRLWTLQEGAFNLHTFVAFYEDHSLELRMLHLQQYAEEVAHPSLHVLFHHFRDVILAPGGTFEADMDHVFTIRDVLVTR